MDEAAAACQEILASQPNRADIWHRLGTVRTQQGEMDAAAQCLEIAFRLESGNSLYANELGIVYKALGRFEDAVRCFQAAVRARPDFVEAWCRLGALWYEQGQLDQAVACYRQALHIAPESLQALNNLGAVLLAQNDAQQAIQCFRQALVIEPARPESYFNLGNAWRALGDLNQALACYRQAVKLRPTFRAALSNLGNALKLLGKSADAVDCYLRVIQSHPEDVNTINSLASTYKEMGYGEEAATLYRRAFRLRPTHPLQELRGDAVCPLVAQSRDEILACRARLEAAIDRYCAMDVRLDPLQVPGIACEPPFSLSYHGMDDRPIREKYAQIFRNCFPDARPSVGTGVPRIGMVVTRGHESLFVRCNRGLLESFDPLEIHLTLICDEFALTRLRGSIKNPNLQFLAIPGIFDRAATAIREARFDLLYYWEVGTDLFNYFLPFLRLAPVQCTGWGIPGTPGLPALDYYISSDLWETDEAEQDYTERLVRLPSLPSSQWPLQPAEGKRTREAFGMPGSAHVYLCVQNLGKFHPDFDAIIAGILQNDPAGVLVAIQGRSEYVTESLKRRLARTVPDVAGRVRFVPHAWGAEYADLIAASDVLLDTPYYGGYNTTYDGLAQGKAVVTMPWTHQRGRYARGCYQVLGISDCVTSSGDAYVETAVRLGTDRDYRKTIERQIQERSCLLFENVAPSIREQECFFRTAVEAARDGTTLTAYAKNT